MRTRQILSRLVLRSLLASAALLLAMPQARGQSNLFALESGNAVTAHSSTIPGFFVEDMFGAMLSPFEPGNTIFQDGQPEGFVHFVEFQTAQVASLTNITLLASGDFFQPDPPVTSQDHRDFGTFNLFAKNLATDAFDLVATFSPTHPEGSLGQPLFTMDFSSPLLAQEFRAEWTQYEAAFGLGGPRIMELQGFGTLQAVPEPGSLALLCGAGVTGLGILLRRRKRA